MIPVARAPKPKSFDEKVRRPGLCAIAEMLGKTPPCKRTWGRPRKKLKVAKGHPPLRERDIPAKKFPTYWTRVLDELMAGYHEVCAYSCFRIHPVTGGRSADHFAPKSRSWRKVYQWANYRLCCTRLNARKKDFSNVLDPFEIQPGWFQLELAYCQVIPDPSLAKEIRDQIQDTIDRLGLNEFWEDRLKDAERYWSGNISL
ncbi:hypothetical protein [Chondromyces apiculatus]|uniref:HNH nuclease domain-containing protein n=1 Tax=Chondromyces apiculatus DSM 436 TaxID=1192034 RepID=A0A017T2E8_9BACT|nr:hypothetical protein [Chondromyces apiculatus]EYF03413.1 Hypothetical protein CAP_5606 [Chondromyces apiculatus DSM 436]